MKKLSIEKRAQVLRCLIEGNSILSTSRITGAGKNTIARFLVEAGEACAAYHDKALRNLPCKVVQLDEVWAFVGCREKNKEKAVNQHPGDVWTWTAIDAETKLVASWRVGDRSARTAHDFCQDLSGRIEGEVQITSDGHPAYRAAVGMAFDRSTAHFAQLVKIYGQDEEGKEVCVGSRKEAVFGNPDMALVSTSFVERQNLNIRMGNRRYTRLTNAFSKKLENHAHMLAVTFMHHNFSRKHTTLKTTPAIAAGIADHVWTMIELVEMIDAHFTAIVEAAFERAFSRYTPRNVTKLRATPKSYVPRPKSEIPLPWYLDPNGVEPS